MRVQLLTGGVPILPGHGDRARSLMHAALENNGVQVIDAIAQRVERDAVITHDERRLATDATLIATGASAAHGCAIPQLALDDRGFIAVNSHLQSISHPFVFAAGDVATLTETPRPKSGVYAVRAAKPLAANLIAATTGKPLCAFEPQRRALYLVSTGPKHAIASWGALGIRRPLGMALERPDRSRLHCEVAPSNRLRKRMRTLAILAFIFLHPATAAACGRTVRTVQGPPANRAGIARRQAEAAVTHAKQCQQPSGAMA